MDDSLFPHCREGTEKSSQADRLISTGQLNALLRLHLRPITWSSSRSLIGRSGFGEGFTLRCFQRLSVPHLATQHYPERDNWYTRGASAPILSY